MLRPGAAAEAPRVRVHPPESLQIPEGSVLELRVEATVRWYAFPKYEQAETGYTCVWSVMMVCACLRRVCLGGGSGKA
eukprot:1152525-Pelagomonas_calceolata.AAC.1